MEICTAEEYLTSEVESEVRHEFRNGEIIEIASGTPTHNEITATFFFLLTSALRKHPYSIFVTDQRLWLPEVNRYTYPDVMITPRPPALQPSRKDTVMNPILIAETLSDSTEAYDRGDKFTYYRTLESVQEYVLIEQSRPHVEHYIKQGDREWLFRDYSGLESCFLLSSVNVETVLADLYEAVEFDRT
ncbi:Uma2 family endonuclease [cf. Phormidesmis sp. LEGE 11477]|uniref:Uma2 family endonuclease n=1 Tax=cf. Phormidesmis sp. LEGE 11477 TaxID=1828680 RepID=UPI0018830CCF|nr:Uma2 family endonuclease [cf. Phormidesmis sp. LEGE 11477]MBE9063814.1 Uma2 family endonuclease [cf. Phormidesmis sp. LEGE 11477]